MLGEKYGTETTRTEHERIRTWLNRINSSMQNPPFHSVADSHLMHMFTAT